MRLINADSMIQSIENNEYYTDKLKRVMNSIVDSRPTVDAVPVVRCAECKHGSKGIFGMMYCNLYSRASRADWFCADGERKGGDE